LTHRTIAGIVPALITLVLVAANLPGAVRRAVPDEEET
jgi:hypothetical protein